MKRRQSAFTLVEMLVILGIMVILIGMLLPTFEKLQHKLRIFYCMNNHRNLSQAYQSYSADHGGHLLGSSTHAGATLWVGAQNTFDSLQSGAVWPYIGRPEVYQCPESVGWQGTYYLRSYSIPTQLDGENWPGLVQVGGLAAMTNASETLLFIDEYDPRHFLVNAFVLPDSGNAWVDYPAIWHGDGIPISFLDGHCEYYLFVDPTTTQKPQGPAGFFFDSTYGINDLHRLQAWVIPNCWYKFVHYN